MTDHDREKFQEPIYSTCKDCGIIVMHDTPPECSSKECPFIDEWADPKPELPKGFENMGEPHEDSDEYEGDGTCTKCDGAGSWLLNSGKPGQTHPDEEICYHCKGTGEEPDE